MKHTPPYYRANMTGNGQGLIIDEETGSNIAIVYDEDDTDEIVHAVNMHSELVTALEECYSTINQLGYLSEDKLYQHNLTRIKEVLDKAERK